MTNSEPGSRSRKGAPRVSPGQKRWRSGGGGKKRRGRGRGRPSPDFIPEIEGPTDIDSALTITVTVVPAVGSVYLADGVTVVSVGDELTTAWSPQRSSPANGPGLLSRSRR